MHLTISFPFSKIMTQFFIYCATGVVYMPVGQLVMMNKYSTNRTILQITNDICLPTQLPFPFFVSVQTWYIYRYKHIKIPTDNF